MYGEAIIIMNVKFIMTFTIISAAGAVMSFYGMKSYRLKRHILIFLPILLYQNNSHLSIEILI